MVPELSTTWSKRGRPTTKSNKTIPWVDGWGGVMVV